MKEICDPEVTGSAVSFNTWGSEGGRTVLRKNCVAVAGYRSQREL